MNIPSTPSSPGPLPAPQSAQSLSSPRALPAPTFEPRRTFAASAGDAFRNAVGALVGHLELLGFGYPVNPTLATVSPTLSRGTQVTADRLAALERQGFRSIVNLRAEDDGERKPVTARGINYLHLPVIDGTAPTREQIKSFLDFVQSPENQPAYVHCAAGMGRTGVMSACYRIAVEGWSLEATLSEARSLGMSMPCQIACVRRFFAGE